MPEEILKPIFYVNDDLEVTGKAVVKEVENGTGSIVTYDETIKELKKRTGAQIIEDLNLAEALQTVPNTRELEAGKGLIGGGNLTENRKFDLGAGGAITKTSTNSVSEDSHTHELGADVKSDIALGITANGWGNHALAGYLTSKRVSTVISQGVNWYRIARGSYSGSFGTSFIIIIERSHGSINNESYTFSINTAFNGKTTITQLSGTYNSRILTKIRVVNTDSEGVDVDIFYNTLGGNNLSVRVIGSGEAVPATIAPTVTTGVTELDTVNGLSVLGHGNSSEWKQAYDWGTHIGKYLSLTGGTVTGNVRLSSGSNNVIPESGSAITNHALSIGTATHGMQFGNLSGGHGYIQMTRVDGTATNYMLNLNPKGGQVAIGPGGLLSGGTIQFSGLSGVGNRMVGVNTNGTLYTTAIPTAENLNVYTKNQVNDLLAPKLEADDLDGFLNDVTYNSDTHVLTFHKQNSPNIVVDLPIESLIKNVVLNGNDLVFTFEDGSTVSVPLNTLLVGVVKEVNGKVPNSQGVITLEISDIPSLSSALDGKSNIRLSNVVSDLDATEKSAFRNKIGAGTVNSVSILLPEGFTTGVSTITDSGTFDIEFSQGYSLPTIERQNEWDEVADEAVRIVGDQDIAGKKSALEKWTFIEPVVIPEGVENNQAVNLSQLGTKANLSLDNIPSNLTTLETNVIKQKLNIDNLQDTGNTYPLIISSEFTSILATIPEVTVENAVAYIRNRNLIVSITLKNSTIANTDVVSVNSIVKLFSLPPEISDVLQAEITAIVPHVKLTSTDVYSTATNKMFLDFEDKSIKQPFRLTLRSSSTTTFYAEFECLDMV